MKILSVRTKATEKGRTITTKQIYNVCFYIVTCLCLISCHSDRKNLSKAIDEGMDPIVIVNIIDDRGDVFVCHYEYEYFCYLLSTDERNMSIIYGVKDKIVNRDTLRIFTNQAITESIKEQQVAKDMEVDSLYNVGGYNLLLRTYFHTFKFIKEYIYFLKYLTSKRHHAVFFPYQAFYKMENDVVMGDSQYSYLLYLLFQNGIYCSFDENLNIILLDHFCNPHAALWAIPSGEVEFK